MTDNKELEALRREVRALSDEMATRRKDGIRRDQQLQLLYENVRDLTTVYQKLAVGLDAVSERRAIDVAAQLKGRHQP